MAKIGLVIDTTTVLDEALIKKYQVEVVSLNVVYNGETMREKDVSQEFMMEHISEVKAFKTASPNPNDFIEAYQRLFQKGFEEILVLPISKVLSGTLQIAQLAKESMQEAEHIHIIDSNICNYGNILLLETLLPMIDAGAPIEEVVQAAQERAEQSKVCFTVLELRHLYHGGRLTLVEAFLGQILRIKPIIEMIDGKLKLAQKVRTTQQIFQVFLNHIGNYVKKFSTVHVKIIHMNCADLYEKLKAVILEKFPKTLITEIHQLDPVFLVHLGKEGIGIAVTAY